MAVRSTPHVPKCRVAGGAGGACSKASSLAGGAAWGVTPTALAMIAAMLRTNVREVFFPGS
jgi:hypothetical protein